MTQCRKLPVLALLSVFFVATAVAQDSITGIRDHSAGVFAEFSVANLGQGQGFINGGSGGAYFQGRLLGWALRGLAEPGGDSTHIYEATVGPRIAVNVPWLRLFLEAGGGAGQASYTSGYGTYARSWGAAWQANIGAEHALLPMVRWRILEVGYSHIYAGPGVSPLIASTGMSLNF